MYLRLITYYSQYLILYFFFSLFKRTRNCEICCLTLQRRCEGIYCHTKLAYCQRRQYVDCTQLSESYSFMFNYTSSERHLKRTINILKFETFYDLSGKHNSYTVTFLPTLEVVDVFRIRDVASNYIFRETSFHHD